MKLFAKLLVLLLILAMAGPFFMRGPDGRPLMSISDVTQKFKSWMGSSTKTSSGSSVEVHRWQDKDGQWHYSDQASGENSEVITVDPNVNVIQSTPVPKPAPVEQDAPAAAAPEKEDKLPNIFHPLDETEKVKEELEQRNKDMLKRLDDT